jgi:hypothetical protein
LWTFHYFSGVADQLAVNVEEGSKCEMEVVCEFDGAAPGESVSSLNSFTAW